MKVVITAEAEADLERIGDVIARDNPLRAVTFVDELVERCRRLAETPRGYPLMPRYERTGVRRRLFGRYLIFYRIDDATRTVAVLHILNSAQDYEAVLFADDAPDPEH